MSHVFLHLKHLLVPDFPESNAKFLFKVADRGFDDSICVTAGCFEETSYISTRPHQSSCVYCAPPRRLDLFENIQVYMVLR